MLTIFANGACGNINHTNVHWDAPQTSPEEAKRLDTILAADVLKSYVDMKQVEDVYIPHQSAYAEGQYEVISTRYAEGSGEMLVTAAIELLGELHKQAIGR